MAVPVCAGFPHELYHVPSSNSMQNLYYISVVYVCMLTNRVSKTRYLIGNGCMNLSEYKEHSRHSRYWPLMMEAEIVSEKLGTNSIFTKLIAR